MYLCYLNEWMFSCSYLAAGASVTLWHIAVCLVFFFSVLKSIFSWDFISPFYKEVTGTMEMVSVKKSPIQMTLFLFLRRYYLKRFSLREVYFPYMYCLYKYLQSNWALFFAVLLPRWLDLVMDLLFVNSLLNFCGSTRSTLWFHCKIKVEGKIVWVTEYICLNENNI